jgi:HSP20 family molecular chaperone IbpA
VQIDVEQHVLTLCVNREDEKKREEEDKETGVTWHHSERSHYYAKRSIRLPETADESKAKASYVDGVLAISFPKVKAEETKMKVAIS